MEGFISDTLIVCRVRRSVMANEEEIMAKSDGSGGTTIAKLLWANLPKVFARRGNKWKEIK
jgi:hypothetical protein